jgi:hypothetical protein
MDDTRFQLAALHIAFLCKMCTQNDVRRNLKVLSETLTDTYDEIYKRILAQKGSAPQLALNAFRWTQCSYEPLRSETLLDAITIEVIGSEEYSRKDTIKTNDILEACQNLLILDERLNIFRFAHLSVDEYLEIQLPKVNSHTEIAKVCLSLLYTPGSWDSGDYDRTLETTEGYYSDRHLLLYSAVFWPWHFSCCEEVNSCQILTGLRDTLLSGANYQRWLNYHRLKVKKLFP